MNRVQTLRSSVPGNRPATGTRAVGELYVCYPDLQLGVINTAQQAQDLLAVRNFSATASYVAGDIIVNGGQIWTAMGPVAPGAFNPANWQSVSAASVTVNDVAPASPHQGDLWYDSLGGQMYCWYDDGSSAQWVIVVNSAPDLSPYALTSYVDGKDTTLQTNINTISATYLPLAGGTMTGPLTGTSATFTGTSTFGVPPNTTHIGPSGNINIDHPAGTARYVAGETSGSARWELALGDNAAETGANAGSNFTLGAYDDTGALLSVPIGANRATGAVTVNGNGATYLFQVPTTGFATLALNKLGAGSSSVLYGMNNGATRWVLHLGNPTAEGGGNSGSDCQLSAFNDAGTVIGTAFVVARSTQIVTFTKPIVNPSARALKNDITPIDSALAIIEKLQGVFFKYKGDPKRQVGLIAEDVAPALPEVVYETGEDKTPGIAYAQIVSVLVEAVKELSAEVKALKQGART